ncbi:hypothetical protein CEXT_29681 [Caerostris extrusa]|uniref:Uncharacterized protein n=1 Tax=Caerostris extrusa TaxID=172846 RepID=A0AAV4U5V2_CAEEX|nr:hypothetical protein CEXT_29681 [Caerostris extrusa]
MVSQKKAITETGNEKPSSLTLGTYFIYDTPFCTQNLATPAIVANRDIIFLQDSPPGQLQVNSLQSGAWKRTDKALMRTICNPRPFKISLKGKLKNGNSWGVCLLSGADSPSCVKDRAMVSRKKSNSETGHEKPSKV